MLFAFFILFFFISNSLSIFAKHAAPLVCWYNGHGTVMIAANGCQVNAYDSKVFLLFLGGFPVVCPVFTIPV